jgi:hypothetical protein
MDPHTNSHSDDMISVSSFLYGPDYSVIKGFVKNSFDCILL